MNLTYTLDDFYKPFLAGSIRALFRPEPVDTIL